MNITLYSAYTSAIIYVEYHNLLIMKIDKADEDLRVETFNLVLNTIVAESQ